MGNKGTVRRLGCALFCIFAPLTAWAAGEQSTGGHASPVMLLLLGLVVILLAAKLGGDVMVRLRQPEVLGELLSGIVLGNLVLSAFRPSPSYERMRC